MDYHDVPRPASPAFDAPRPDAPTDIAFDYTLTIELCAEQYALAGHARTIRTIQRYCKNGALDARKVTTLTADKFLVTPHSLRRHIEELNQLAAQTATIGQGWTPFDMGDFLRHRPTPAVAPILPRSTALDTPRNVATEHSSPSQKPGAIPDIETPKTPDGLFRPDATTRDRSPAAAPHPESEIIFLRDQIATKDAQLAVKDRQLEAKDTQITALLDRNKESNVLIQTMQQLLGSFLPHLKPPEQGSGPAASKAGEPVLN